MHTSGLAQEQFCLLDEQGVCIVASDIHKLSSARMNDQRNAAAVNQCTTDHVCHMSLARCHLMRVLVIIVMGTDPPAACSRTCHAAWILC